MISLITLLTLLFATMSLAAALCCAIADEPEDIIQAGVIKIAVPSAFPVLECRELSIQKIISHESIANDFVIPEGR